MKGGQYEYLVDFHLVTAHFQRVNKYISISSIAEILNLVIEKSYDKNMKIYYVKQTLKQLKITLAVSLLLSSLSLSLEPSLIPAISSISKLL